MTFSRDEDFARQLDAEDPLNHFREKFHLPPAPTASHSSISAGNSLGLMPKSARQIVGRN
jgi:kynureninase